MALGKGGSSGSQSSNTAYSGTGTTDTSGSTRAVAPTGWEDLWRGITGMGGTTPGQDTAAGYFNKQLTSPDSTSNQVFDYARWFADKASNTPPPATVTAPTLAGQDAVASHAYDTMDKYQNPWTQQVVDATTADLEKARSAAQNRSNMAATAAGGIANARTGLRDAEVQDNFLRTLAGTTAGLRSQGFNTAAGLGAGDAGLATGVSQGNADRGVQVQNINAQNNLAAQYANIANTFLGQQQAGANASSALDAVLRSGGIKDSAAAALAGLGGGQFSQLLAGLTAGTPLFGVDTQESGKTTASGTSTSRGKNSSKGGGFSIG